MKLPSAPLSRSAMYAAWLLAGAMVPVLAPVCSTSVHAQQPGPSPEEIFKAGNDNFRAGRFKEAIPWLEKFERDQKLHPNNDVAILFLGICYAQTGEWDKGIKMLEKLKTVDKTVEKKPLHEQALFYLLFVNYNYAMGKDFAITTEPKEKDPNFAKRKKQLETTLAWYTELLKKYPDTGFKEDATFYAALIKTQLDDYAGAEKDLQALVKDFPRSVSVPDYQFVLGQIYQTQAAKLAQSKKGTLHNNAKAKEEVEAAVTKTMEQYRKIASNKEAPSTANEAQLNMAEMMYYLAAMQENPDAANTADAKKDYVVALKEYRKVKRRDDIVVSLEAEKARLLKEIQDAAAANDQKRGDLIRPRYQRVSGRVEETKSSPDPRITAMIRMARIYNELAQYGEARVLIRRLIDSGSVDAANKKEIENLLILSYALDGADDKANEALDKFYADYGKTDKASEGVSFFIANALRRKDPPRLEDAIKNYDRSLKDYPNGAFAAEAAMRRASTLVSLKRADEAMGDLQAFVTKNATHPAVNEARYSLADIYLNKGKFDEALKVYQTIKADPKAGPYKPFATWWAGICYASLGKPAEAIKEFQEYIPQAKPEDVPGAMSKLADAYLANKQVDEALKTLKEIANKYPKDINAPFAMERVAAIYEDQKQTPEMLAANDEVIRAFPKTGSALRVNSKLAIYFAKLKDYDKAAKYYSAVANFDFSEMEKAVVDQGSKKPDYSEVKADALWRIANMYLGACRGGKVYSMLEGEEKAAWDKNIDKAQKAFTEVLLAYPEKTAVMGRTSEGLASVLMLRVSANLLPAAEVFKVLDGISAQATDPAKSAAVRTRVELTKALIAADTKHAEALAMYQKIAKDNPNLVLAPSDVRRFGELLRLAGKAGEAEELYKKLKTDFPPDDAYADAEYTFGMGSVALAKGDIPTAKTLFTALTTKYAWHPSIGTMEPIYGLGQGAELEAEKETNAAKKKALQDEAIATYNRVVTSRTSAQELKARSLFGMGKVLEAQGNKLRQPAGGLNAVDTYFKIYLFYPKLYPDIIPEALWRAGQIYHAAFPGEPDPNKSNELKRNAAKCYEGIIKDYPNSPFTKRAEDALRVLGPIAPPAPAKK
ncbi:hypothetical protein DB346_14470 [Verrucomicrobia bacterium LW23]|nr:hypothetical protein DB346_14470 [Verrucomicrobia bacterium LW23]